MEKKQEGLSCGVIGYSDEGEPIVMPTYCCGSFIGQEDSLCLVRECWYCKYADFRKNTNIRLNQSICHCRKNQIVLQKQNSQIEEE